jgi:hypothetical protein
MSSWQGLFEVAEVKNDIYIKVQQSWGSQIKDKINEKYIKNSQNTINVLTTDHYSPYI